MSSLESDSCWNTCITGNSAEIEEGEGTYRGCAGKVEGRQAVHATCTLFKKHFELIWEGEEGHEEGPEGHEHQLEEKKTCRPVFAQYAAAIMKASIFDQAVQQAASEALSAHQADEDRWAAGKVMTTLK